MANIENYRLVGGKKCNEVLAAHPDYKVFRRSGFAYRGAGEREINREGLRKLYYPGGSKMATFEEEMKQFYSWAAAIDIDVDHDKKEIHINGFSENDMW